MGSKARIARNLAIVLSSRAWTKRAIVAGVRSVFGSRAPKSVDGLADWLLKFAATPYTPPPDRIRRFILAAAEFDLRFRAAIRRFPNPGPPLAEPKFRPLQPFRRAGIPQFTTTSDLAEWLELPVSQIEWLADLKVQHGRGNEPRLQNYTYHWMPKRSGLPRLIEAPKARLKLAQRLILRDILDHVPVHAAAHGFVAGRSCLSAARKHGGEKIVITLDLKDFFLTVPLRRVHGLFRCLGYPWPVARILTGLCGTSTPLASLGGEQAHLTNPIRYRTPHLPQGAPTSPALANLCSHRLDCRLEGLANRLDARYTRYADDLAFSGDAALAGEIGPFLRGVAEIVRDEGFTLNPGKTRIMRPDGRQYVTGLVVNRHLNVPRDVYDRLKATLHNCRRLGPQSQNRDGLPDFRAHLDGRITWVETVNLQRGFRLRQLFEAIEW